MGAKSSKRGLRNVKVTGCAGAEAKIPSRVSRPDTMETHGNIGQDAHGFAVTVSGHEVGLAIPIEVADSNGVWDCTPPHNRPLAAKVPFAVAGQDADGVVRGVSRL